MWLTRLAVERPIVTITVVAALMLFGWFGARRMPAAAARFAFRGELSWQGGLSTNRAG